MANTFIFDDNEQPEPDDNSLPAETDEPAPEGGDGESGNNRTFMIVAIALGGIVLLSLICVAVYALVILPGQRSQANDVNATNVAVQTQAAIGVMQTSTVMAYSPTPLPTETSLPTETPTPLIPMPTDTPVPGVTIDPLTATVNAQFTQLSKMQLLTEQAKAGTQAPGAGTGTAASSGGAGSTAPANTSGTPKATATMPNSGFADEVGLPGMIILSAVLLVVILLARRLRMAPAR